MHRGYFLVVVISLTQGCLGSASPMPGFRTELFFSDPKVVELCRAIESNDLSKVDVLVKEGVDVNSLGRGNVNPLFWAFSSKKLRVFERLLQHGDHPNIIMTTSSFKTS